MAEETDMSIKIPLHQIPVQGFLSAVQSLQALELKDQRRILDNIQSVDLELAKKLEQALLSFSDLQFMHALDFKLVWWDLPRKTWILSLRNAPSEVWQMIQKNVSQRAFVELKESVTVLGPQPLSRVQKAQREICDAINALAAEGRMALPRADKRL